MNELKIEAKIENMDAVQGFINEHITACSEKTTNQILIAIDEIFSNISLYAYNLKIGIVTIRIEVRENIVIVFEDEGIEYDPLASEDPDVSTSLEDRKAGGLGIFLVKNIMDSVTYKREGNKNILTLTKNL